MEVESLIVLLVMKIEYSVKSPAFARYLKLIISNFHYELLSFTVAKLALNHRLCSVNLAISLLSLFLLTVNANASNKMFLQLSNAFVRAEIMRSAGQNLTVCVEV
jgi:hypothetical protein